MEENKTKKWMPKVGGKYYIILNSHVGGRGARKRIWEGSALDMSYYNQGLMYKTKAEATFIFKMMGAAY